MCFFNSKLKICKKTVMDSTDPYISFDKDGISNHYHEFHERLNKSWFPNEEGKRKHGSEV